MEICTEWAGCKNAYGYGVRKIGGRRGKVVPIHREVYAAKHGPIPKGMVVMHKCDNPACINPEHLKLGTQRDNIQDAISKNRVPQLSDRVVDRDRVKDLLRFGYSRMQIAKWLGVQHSSVYRAVPVGG